MFRGNAVCYRLQPVFFFTHNLTIIDLVMSLEVLKVTQFDDPSDLPILIIAPDWAVITGSWLRDSTRMQMDNFQFHTIQNKKVFPHQPPHLAKAALQSPHSLYVEIAVVPVY